MQKFLLIALLAIAGMMAFRIWNIHQQHKRTRKKQEQENTSLVPCDHCGTHVVYALAIKRDGKLFCTHEHARLHGHKQRE